MAAVITSAAIAVFAAITSAADATGAIVVIGVVTIGVAVVTGRDVIGVAATGMVTVAGGVDAGGPMASVRAGAGRRTMTASCGSATDVT
ncbi:exported protein of unknown function [Hyphomicrobium sp. MC1]|nr:exported protein of unknown function [Hyphomicrobium sp. MC1]